MTLGMKHTLQGMLVIEEGTLFIQDALVDHNDNVEEYHELVRIV